MMKILIVEDEALAADRLEEMIMQLMPDSIIMAKTTSITTTVDWLQHNTPDLIFLDIQLSDGLSFSIFEKIKVLTPVIFTTAYDQYAIRAFQLNSIAYLLKPVKKAELQTAINKLRTLQSVYSQDLEGLLASIQGRDPGYKKRFLIQIADKIRKVEISDVAYFFALDRYVFMRTFQNNTYPLDHTLDNLVNMVDPAKFFRINRKYIVNIDAIGQMVAWSRSRVKLELSPAPDDPMETIVSIDRAADFKKWLNS